MEREVLEKKSPLFGLRTAQIKLEPFTFREAALFHPNWTVDEKAKTRFLCGGVLYYLECFDSEAIIPQNIRQSFSPLFRESEYLLRKELRELENYHSILLALAQGNQTLKYLSQQTCISYFLKKLEGLHYITRAYPVFSGKKFHRVLYALHYSLFRFIHSRQSLLKHLGPRAYL